MVKQLWPVYSWNDSTPIRAPIVPRSMALDEIVQSITEADLKRALSTCDVYDYEAGGKPLQAANKDFYLQRKDRRIGKG